MRQIILDTETTGIDPKQGHRVIEIGCVEMIDRKLTGNHYHVYINPQRVIEQEAINVHGITNESLVDKPIFSAIADEFLDFIRGAELVIHNAAFDVGFINHEFSLLRRGFPNVEECCGVLDTLALARKKHPGQKNNLDALCKRYFIDNSSRTLHGALLDSEILAEVYLAMTGGQTALSLSGSDDNAGDSEGEGSAIRRLAPGRAELRVISASDNELQNHQNKLEQIQKKSGNCLWLAND
ncbi:DNA polymerase III subunit epsilon [Endozoicomonas sp. SCSIO W0465]|uniref:DNA polymerase III subunit epsilon n=1 Tax=Endozoicomonas sp. SCSIO W0465 TaxID=2918516 RepID=UPI00207605AC|nr:DNA polymerase III subunit epsilon [Endozoicomonas sp. SCSIO W0465]USE39480.1 DNA polymerase III subunit epsilon [Endozoicomonas sp. SCSIO W0465]